MLLQILAHNSFELNPNNIKPHVYYYYYLRNFWTKAVGLSEDLKEFYSNFRENSKMLTISQALDTLFILTSNYNQGDGDVFRVHIEEYHPYALLTSALSLKGNIKDVTI